MYSSDLTCNTDVLATAVRRREGIFNGIIFYILVTVSCPCLSFKCHCVFTSLPPLNG